MRIDAERLMAAVTNGGRLVGESPRSGNEYLSDSQRLPPFALSLRLWYSGVFDYEPY